MIKATKPTTSMMPMTTTRVFRAAMLSAHSRRAETGEHAEVPDPATSPPAARRIEIGIGDEEAGLRLDRALQSRLPELSRSRLKQLIVAGHVIRAGDAAHQFSRD